MFKKVKFFFVLLIIVSIFSYINFKIDEDILFFADNSTKFYQGYAVVYNHFKDDTIRCQWLEELGQCKFFQITNTMAKKGEEVYGAFPFALSYLNGILIKFISHKWILWLSEVIFILFIYFLYISKWVDIRGILVLFFFTPLFIQFYTFLDLAFQVFFISFFWIYYKKLQDKELTPLMSFFLGFITGLNFYFRPEGLFYLLFLLSFLIIFDKDRIMHLFYSFGIFLTFFFLTILNYYFYQNIFGRKLEMIQSLILNLDFSIKMSNAIGLIWGSEHRVGFFQYMPWIVIVLILSVLHFKKLTLFWKIQLISMIVSLVFVISLTPNDSNGDFGSRYLSIFILTFLFLGDHIKQFYKKNRILNLIMILSFLISGYFTYKYFHRMVLKVNQDASRFYREIPEEFKRNSLWIFHSNFAPSIFGYHLVENKSIVLEHQEEVEEFNKILKQKNYERVVVFHTYFFKETIKSDELQLKDRFFYEDKVVKDRLLDILQQHYLRYEKKEIQIRDNRFDFYMFQK